MALFDAFLKIDGIDGEIKGQIQLESFSWGLSNTRSNSSGAGSGKVMFQDFSFATRLGKQSPQLFLAAAEGRNIPTAQLVITEKRANISVSFFDVFISSYKEDLVPAVQGNPVALEMVSLNFAKVEILVGQ